ncbi:hypothetical protein K2173_019131 [Erythroxylum novogranatense]|uniref:Uncharacterized protein n=1 Tax=Erythroxylum novogranatense TaxID=1862640 RepID=A0AAV8STF2_9ROSI|nr:hypothetical protein K2173_019131 [Erythroxylum novogranatense]
MGISGWFCSNSSHNMVVKIVYPGGNIELHENPILAAEIMLQNPESTVAYPRVFKDPWATVAPDTMLMLGQKYYVLPVSTIRKLQRRSLRYTATPKTHDHEEDESDDEVYSNCCFIQTKNSRKTNGCLSDDHCFSFLKTEARIRIGDALESTGSKSSPGTCSESRELIRKRKRDSRGSPYNHWKPRLGRIYEE